MSSRTPGTSLRPSTSSSAEELNWYRHASQLADMMADERPELQLYRVLSKDQTEKLLQDINYSLKKIMEV